MGVDRPIDITADQRKTILSLLKRHLPNTMVWVYGSRVKWTSRPQSDLDLVVFTKPDQERRVSELREVFEESNLPFRVDLLVWRTIPEQYRKQIEAEHVVLVEREEKAVREEWASVQLDEVVDLLAGFPFKSDSYVNDPKAPRLLRGDNIAQGTLRWDGAKRWPQEATDNLTLYWLREGDVVIAMDRPWIEAGLKFSSLRETDLPALLVQRVARLRGSDHLDTRFLNYVIGSRDFTEYVLSVQTGTAIPHISAQQIKEFKFSLPPVPEQRAIAHVLGTLDDKIELNRRMNETLEAMARALFKSWFIDFDPIRAKAALLNHSPLEGESVRQGRQPAAEPVGGGESVGHPPPHQPSPRGSASATPPQGGSDWTVERARAYLDSMDEEIAALFPDRLVDSELGPIPEGWEVGCFGDVVEQIRDKENPLASPEAIFHHFSIPAFDEDQWPKIERGENIKSQKSRALPGMVLLSKLNPEIERVWLVDVDASDRAVCSTEFLVLRPWPPYGRAFSYCLGRSPAFLQKLSSLVTGTSKSHQRAQADAVLALPVVLCPKPLAELFERRVAAFLQMTQVNRRESRTLTALRDALLPKLISGELRINGHSDHLTANEAQESSS